MILIKDIAAALADREMPCKRPEAEREGFEPSMDETAHTGFRDRLARP
jgi:hypothetical protein